MKQAVVIIISLAIGVGMGIFLITYNDKSECKIETIGHVFEVGTNCHASD